MAVKSIIDIDLNDGKFRAFTRLFDGYQKALKSQPDAWKLINDKIDGTRSSFDKVVDKMVAANVQARLMEKAQERADQLTRTSADRWATMARSAREFASGIRDATSNLIRIGSYIGLAGGLVGAGGLFGLDRLAGGVSATRRSGLGLGIGYGDQRAFSTNFGRLVDPESFLSGVAGAKLDVTKRVGLLGAGLSNGEIGGDTGTTAVALLKRLKTIADTTNPALYAQVIRARRLDQFTSPEDLQRLHNTGPAEFNRLVSSYGKDRSSFAIGGNVAERWQDFSTQLSRAGENIEAVFVRGLTPLIPGITKLSDSVAKAVETLLSSDKLKGWLEQFGAGIEKFAKYLGSDDFEREVKSFVDGIGKLGSAITWLLGKLPGEASNVAGATTGTLIGGALGGLPGAMVGGYVGSMVPIPKNQTLWSLPFGAIGVTASPFNNPGNIRPPGRSTGFLAFPTPEAGVKAMAEQLRIYGRRDNINSVGGIVSKYAPATENNTAAYVADVSKKTGFGAGDKLDLSNPDVLAKVLSAMISHEQKPGTYDRYKDAKIVVEVIKPTGSDTAVSVNGVKGN